MPRTKKLDPISKLSITGKIQAVQTMHSFGKDYKEIAKILGISMIAVKRYATMNSPEEWQSYYQGFRRVLAMQEDKLLVSVIAKLKNELPEAKYSDAIEVFKTLKENKKNGTPAVNISGDSMKVEFVASDPNTK